MACWLITPKKDERKKDSDKTKNILCIQIIKKALHIPSHQNLPVICSDQAKSLVGVNSPFNPTKLRVYSD